MYNDYYTIVIIYKNYLLLLMSYVTASWKLLVLQYVEPKNDRPCCTCCCRGGMWLDQEENYNSQTK